MAAHGVPLIGVNLGRLGFLTDIPADKVAETLSRRARRRLHRRGAAACSRRACCAPGARSSRTHAMNDVVVSRGGHGQHDRVRRARGRGVHLQPARRRDHRRHAHRLHRLRAVGRRPDPAPGPVGDRARADLAAHALEPAGGHPAAPSRIDIVLVQRRGRARQLRRAVARATSRRTTSSAWPRPQPSRRSSCTRAATATSRCCATSCAGTSATPEAAALPMLRALVASRLRDRRGARPRARHGLHRAHRRDRGGQVDPGRRPRPRRSARGPTPA